MAKMNVSSRRKGPDQEQLSGSFISKKIDSIISWLTHLIQLTEEEREDAGIYLSDQ
jgi:hypothetical protein